MLEVLNMPFYSIYNPRYEKVAGTMLKISLNTALLQNLCNYIRTQDHRAIVANEGIINRLWEASSKCVEMDVFRKRFNTKYMMLIYYESFFTKLLWVKEFFEDMTSEKCHNEFFDLSANSFYHFNAFTYFISSNFEYLIENAQIDFYSKIQETTHYIKSCKPEFDKDIFPDGYVRQTIRFLDEYYTRLIRFFPHSNPLGTYERLCYLLLHAFKRHKTECDILTTHPYNGEKPRDYRTKKHLSNYLCFVNFLIAFSRDNDYCKTQEDVGYALFCSLFRYTKAFTLISNYAAYIGSIMLMETFNFFKLTGIYFERASERFILLLLTSQKLYPDINFRKLIVADWKNKLACRDLLDYDNPNKVITNDKAFTMIQTACKLIPFREKYEVSIYIEMIAFLLRNEKIRDSLINSYGEIKEYLTQAINCIFGSHLNNYDSYERTLYADYLKNIRHITCLMSLNIPEPFLKLDCNDFLAPNTLINKLKTLTVEEYSKQGDLDAKLLMCFKTIKLKFRERPDIDDMQFYEMRLTKIAYAQHPLHIHSQIYDKLISLTKNIAGLDEK
jgi:hypothetical protein